MSYKPVTKAEAKYEALLAAVETLKNHGFRPDPREFPREADQKKLSAAFSEVLGDMESRLEKARVAFKKTQGDA